MEINVEEYYSRYAPMVMRRCLSILKDEDLAADAMQEVFMKVIENRKKLKNTYPSSLLYTIATNHCLNVLKSRKREIASPGEYFNSFAAAAREDAAESLINREMLGFIFENEKDTTLDIAYMYYIDGMTHDDVARTVGMSVSGIRKRLRNLREKAGTLIGEEI